MHTFSQKVDFLESIFGKGNLGRTGNLEVWCPFCAETNRKKKKLAIKVNNDFVHCWVCGYKAKTLIKLIRMFGTKHDLDEYANEFIFDKTRLITIDDDSEHAERVHLPRDFRLLGELGASTLESAACFHYLTSRGLSERDIWLHKLGCSSDARWLGRVIIPSFDDQGELNYFVGRSIYPASKRYDQPKQHKTMIIFNDVNIDWSQELVLCEGPFDLIKCPTNSTCLLGSELDEGYFLFDKIVELQTPVCLLLDSDALIHKTLKIAKSLNSFNIRIRIARLPVDADPGALDKHEVEDIVKNAQSYSWSDSFKIKLAAGANVRTSIK